jgi:nucleotide-binding universal stress UspA family protein
VLSDDERRVLAEFERRRAIEALEPDRLRRTDSRPGQQGPVVVAVGSYTTGQALDWAAAEASARGCRLHVVHAERLRCAVDPSGLVPVADFWSDRVAADDILRAALSRARSAAPDLDVSAELEWGPTVPSLVSQSNGAQLLVLGSRNPPLRRRLTDRLARSVRDRVTDRAFCPVALVLPLQTDPHAGSRPRVVVGIDGHGSCAAALGVAFRAAAQRAVPLTAVHAWTPDIPADHEGVCGSMAASEARARQVLDWALAPWRSRFADVSVGTRLSVADPATALIRESEGAALVAVGSRARGAATGRFFSSVSRSVARGARCPVVVVRTGTVTAGEQDESERRTAVRGVDQAGTEAVHRRRTPWE